MRKFLFVLILSILGVNNGHACSILYFIDSKTGNIYAVNNEDSWFDVNPFIRIEPKSKDKLARLWYGWDDFAQGGINEEGLFFDGAATPEQRIPVGYTSPHGNLGDDMLSSCKNVDEAIAYLEDRRVALNSGHILLGDKTGNAVVIEWVKGEKKIIYVANNRLIATNFLLADTTTGNYPCTRYKIIENSLDELQQNKDSISLKDVGNIMAKVVQPQKKNAEGRAGGTLYTTFVDFSEMKFILVYKLENSKTTSLELKNEFAIGKRRKIKLE